MGIGVVWWLLQILSFEGLCGDSGEMGFCFKSQYECGVIYF